MTRILIAAALVGAAVMLSDSGEQPVPPAPAALDLSAVFAHEDGAKDCLIVAEMCDSIADIIEWDGMQPDPLLATGVQLDEMRTRTRELMIKGESLGEKYPALRDAEACYLDEKVGNSGGVVTPAGRAAWVAAYRAIAESARAVIQ